MPVRDATLKQFFAYAARYEIEAPRLDAELAEFITFDRELTQHDMCATNHTPIRPFKV